jgi:hypothetical protein
LHSYSYRGIFGIREERQSKEQTVGTQPVSSLFLTNGVRTTRGLAQLILRVVDAATSPELASKSRTRRLVHYDQPSPLAGTDHWKRLGKPFFVLQRKRS